MRIIILLFLLNQGYIHAQTIGILQNTADSFNGYTLFAPTRGSTSYLIDNCGNQINTWSSEFAPAVSAYLLENGDLLRTARILNSPFPTITVGGKGGRLERYDWEGNLVWSYNYSDDNTIQHHDIQALENGNILMLAWRFFSEEQAQQLGRSAAGELWAEEIIEIEPVGTDAANIVWQWSALNHIVQDNDSGLENFGVINQFPERWNINYSPEGSIADWLHFNSISYNPIYDQIMLSSKHLSEIYVIDHSTTTAESMSHSGGNYGKGGDILYRWGNPIAYNSGTPSDHFFFGQHDAHWIPEGRPDAGKIMVYNNGENRPAGNFSTVDIINPPIADDGSFPTLSSGNFLPDDLYSSYGENAEGFYSSILSGAQRQPNGNTVICEGVKGRIFEINPENEIVWEYISPTTGNAPFTQGDININNNDLFRAYRYAADYPAFTDRDLTPGLPIELEPINQDCIISLEEMVANSNIIAEEIFLVQNPINSQLQIENTLNSTINISIYDISGRLMTQVSSTQNRLTIDVNDWQKGLYIVHISEEENNRISNFKVTKF